MREYRLSTLSGASCESLASLVTELSPHESLASLVTELSQFTGDDRARLRDSPGAWGSDAVGDGGAGAGAAVAGAAKRSVSPLRIASPRGKGEASRVAIVEVEASEGNPWSPSKRWTACADIFSSSFSGDSKDGFGRTASYGVRRLAHDMWGKVCPCLSVAPVLLPLRLACGERS